MSSSEKDQNSKGETGLFAAVRRMDERLAIHGWPLNKELLLAQNTFDKAHAVMMAEEEIINTADASEILKVLREVDKLGPADFPWGKGDLWAQKERFVIDRIGEDVGGRLHTGRSRQDVGVTTNRLHLRPKVIEMANGLNEFRAVLLELAGKHIETVMPCYTWTQHAQPTTLAHYLLSFVYAFARDYRRLVSAYKETNKSPAGAALQTGTSYPLNRERTKTLMGFDEVIRNTRDAAMNFDYLYEIMVAASLSIADLLRLLEELSLWHSVEFNMISLDDPWCGTSSIMPQKRNPYPFMVVRGKAAKAFGRTTAIFTTLEAPALGPSAPFFLQNDTDEVIDEHLGIFILAAGFMATMRVNESVMLERAGAYWAQGTDLADLVVRERGLSFRTAHHVIAELVKIATEEGKSPADIDAAMIDHASINVGQKPLELDEDLIRSALDPRKAVEIRQVYGGTSLADVAQQIEESVEHLKSDREQIDGFEQSLRTADQMLANVISSTVRNGD